MSEILIEDKIKLSTWEILRRKFPANECVLIEEVSDASGFERSRSLDFMAINLWNSRGLSINGIEKKSFRNDWLKELKNPAKQENHFKYCDYFYLLTDKENVAKLEEIPDTWGWYHISGNSIKTMKAAPKLVPLPIGKSLMCAMLRRAADKTNYIHKDEIQTKIEELSEQKKQYYSRELERKAEGYDNLKRDVTEFENASGVKITGHWHGENKKIGETVKIIMNNGVEGYIQNISRLEKQIGNMHKGIVDNIRLMTKEQEVQVSDTTKMPDEQKPGQ